MSYWESAEIYDPVSGTWSADRLDAHGTRYYHTSTLLSDGRVLVSGGTRYCYRDTYLASAEIYNPALGTWSLTAAMSTPRIGHTATLLPDGRVLVSGGFAAGTTILASAEIYSPGAPPPEDATPPKCHAPRRTARGITPMSPLHAPQVISNRGSRTRRMRAFTSPPVCRPGRRRPAPPRTAARSATSWVTAVRLLLSPGTRWTRRRRRSRSRCRWRVRQRSEAKVGASYACSDGALGYVVYRASRKRQSRQHVVQGTQNVRGDSHRYRRQFLRTERDLHGHPPQKMMATNEVTIKGIQTRQEQT